MRTLYVLMTGLAIAACSRQVPQGETIFVDGIRCVAFGNRAVSCDCNPTLPDAQSTIRQCPADGGPCRAYTPENE